MLGEKIISECFSQMNRKHCPDHHFTRLIAFPTHYLYHITSVWVSAFFVAKTHIEKLAVYTSQWDPLLPLPSFLWTVPASPLLFSSCFPLTHKSSPANLVSSRAGTELISPDKLSRFTQS